MSQTQDTTTDPKRAAYSAATTRLRNDHREEFNRLVKEEMAARDIEWEPRPTEEDKASTQIEALLEKYPDLRAKFSNA